MKTSFRVKAVHNKYGFQITAFFFFKGCQNRILNDFFNLKEKNQDRLCGMDNEDKII